VIDIFINNRKRANRSQFNAIFQDQSTGGSEPELSAEIHIFIFLPKRELFRCVRLGEQGRRGEGRDLPNHEELLNRIRSVLHSDVPIPDIQKKRGLLSGQDIEPVGNVMDIFWK